MVNAACSVRKARAAVIASRARDAVPASGSDGTLPRSPPGTARHGTGMRPPGVRVLSRSAGRMPESA